MYFEGQILNINDGAFTNIENVTLANDGILHLFSQIKYTINGQPIEDILNPAISSIMLGMLRYPDDFSKSKGLMQCWFKDNGNGGTDDNDNVGRRERKKLFFGFS